ncbi:serine/threonine/tyrosine-interacting-like protein 1 [Dysidea avara]|uniref:serine/threonine/tyrosine-interacting-like protein 1 n=1 Tax=Dysidea avara TaxID=196820 RepID=UPI0033278092
MAIPIALCEPTELYNVLTEDAATPVLTDKNHLLLIDSRERKAYEESHVIVARHAPINELTGQVTTFGDIDLPMVVNVIVYDSKTVSIVEQTRAIKCAEMLYTLGSKNPVKVLKGGYERFSAEYPFLRTQKIIYSSLELEHMPRYPSEVLPLFLYVGDHGHACNASMNYDMKINSHINMIAGLPPSYPGSISELHVDVEDKEDTDLLARFEEIYSYIEAARQKSERLLVFSELGISRAPVACIAYLMKKNKWTLHKGYEHVCKCRRRTRPLRVFIIQLSKWEEMIHGEVLTDISEPNY